MNWQDKNGVTQSSKFVVTVSNWHFNRNTLKQEKAPVCKLENIMITLKLASTVFEATETTSNSAGAGSSKTGGESPEKELGSPGAAAAAAGPASGAVKSQTGETYTFDKNGAIIPYAAFVSLLDAPDFQKYLAQVKKQYRRDRPTSDEKDADSSCEGTEDLVSSDEDEEEAKARAFLAKRKRKVIEARNKMRYSKVRKTIEFDSESDNDIDAPPSSQATNEYQQQQEQLGVTPLPSADEDDEKNEKEEAKTREAENDKAKEVEEGGKEEKKEPRKTRTKQK